jgi:plasmid maintenance system killer protein
VLVNPITRTYRRTSTPGSSEAAPSRWVAELWRPRGRGHAVPGADQVPPLGIRHPLPLPGGSIQHQDSRLHRLDSDSARRVIEFQVDDQVQERIHQLATAANEGRLDAQGRNEYEALINASDFVSILKLKARQQLRTDAA